MPQFQKRGAILIVPHPAADVSTREQAAKAPYLTIRRSAEVIAPLRLCFPGGGLEPDETAEEAGVREFQEEIGCRIVVRRKIWENVTPWHVRLDWFLAALADPDSVFTPQKGEVAEVFWSDFSSLLTNPDVLESNVEFLRKGISGELDLHWE